MNQQTYSQYLSRVSETGDVRSGSPLPLGAHSRGSGVNFSLFSRHATAVRLEFYDRPGDGESSRTLELDPERNRTGDVWHVWIEGVEPGQLYGYRVDGPYEPEEGFRFNPHKLLLDPLARAITYQADWDFGSAQGYDPQDPEKDLSFSEEDSAAVMPKSIFTENQFNWEGDHLLKRPLEETVIYETHVRGLTIDESSGVEHPGTYAGLVEKIPYFQELGVTAVELMPVQEFNENEVIRVNPETDERLKNYWGYNPVAFMAPESAYCSRGSAGQQTISFKEMVKALHEAGIEVILDVVFNHTAEGNALGPTLSFRGLANTIYYILGDGGRSYQNYTGTGNTVKADHPVVRDFILGALRYWVVEMHVDGFRFDLASVLGRDENGDLMPDPPLLDHIAEDLILREAKIIAEAWDAGGAYQVGGFSDRRWAEWNGKYRDDVRRFWRGDEGMVGEFADRISGSADLYQGTGKGPARSINFVACHDGFTLNDLVSYARKHNEANGEDNEDGIDENFSANYGVEGPTDDEEIKAVRRRQIKNFFLTLFISRGVPMVLGGDEFRRTQQGNNNAYCQDNEISWYDWSDLETHEEIYRFTRGMIDFRQAHPVVRRNGFYTEEEVTWCGPDGAAPEWGDPQARELACLIRAGEEEADLLLMFNAAAVDVTFPLPERPEDERWAVAVDTGAQAPDDLYAPGEEAAMEDPSAYRLGPRSSAILVTVTG